MRCLLRYAIYGAIAVVAGAPAHAAQGLDASLKIYWIDVEGGAATLIVTPRRQVVLMDAGWARPDERDARRIQAAMQDV